jgi:cobalt-zinc-cadmium efflux system outer membrane protein
MIVSMPDSTTLQYEKMIDHAEENRPDYLSKLKEISYQEMNTKLQQSRAVPDLLIGYQPHDKGSNYVRPYAGLVVEMDIPVFNRNQGNIAAAKANVDRVKIEADQAYTLLQNEVSASLNKYYNSLSALSNYDLDFLRELEALNNNALENYNRKNLGILQYIDMQRTYIKTMAEYLGLQSEVLQRINDLEFTTGLTLYH